jgi:hypothetical protein
MIRSLPLLAIVLLSAGCKREEAPAAPTTPAESAPALRAASRPVSDWFVITVDPDPGWDAAEIARIAANELDVCREVLKDRLGVAIGPQVLEVRFVHDGATVDDLARATPAGVGFLRLDERGLFRWKGSLLVLSRGAEAPDRAYLMILALLQLHSGIGPIRWADAVARWGSGLATCRLRGEPLWGRGRVEERAIAQVRQGHGSPTVAEICAWASQPFPFAGDLARRDPATGLNLDGIDPRFTDFVAVDGLRGWSWFLVYFLASFDAGEDGRVRFGGTSRYDSLLRALVAKREPGSPAPCEMLARHERLPREFPSYVEFAMRKLNLGQARNGILIPADEFVNRAGKRTANPDDDLLNPK